MAEKALRLERLSEQAWARSGEGDDDTGIVVGSDGVRVIDTQAMPRTGQRLVRPICGVTDRPIRYVVLSGCDAAWVPGASACGAQHRIATQEALDLAAERGEKDLAKRVGRVTRPVHGIASGPGLTRPKLAVPGGSGRWLGRLEVPILQPERDPSEADTVAWLPQDGALCPGDPPESDANLFTGGAGLGDWPVKFGPVAGLRPEELVPGRGSPLRKAFRHTRAAVEPRDGERVIPDRLPGDVARGWGEAAAIAGRRVWTAPREPEMWPAQEG